MDLIFIFFSQAKKLLRDFRQREIDMIHREEFYQQLVQEKDTEYNALVKTLKDRVIRLEVLLLVTITAIMHSNNGSVTKQNIVFNVYSAY